MACFTGLHYLIPFEGLFPGIYDLLPGIERDKITTQPFADTSLTKPDTVNLIETDADSLEYSASGSLNDSLQFPGLISSSFDSINANGGQIRILYYGDSQIEGDRITSYLRSTLRNRYGGSGPGLFLPVMPVMYTKTLFIRSSSNWKRYNYLSYKEGLINGNSLGPFMTVCRYIEPDQESPSEEQATVRVDRSVYSDSTTALFKILRILYGNVTGRVRVEVKCDGKVKAGGVLNRGEGISEYNCPLDMPDNVTIEFTGKTSPDIYAISIEDSSGVVVDNLPQRGSAGLEFTMVDRRNLEESFRLIDPDMFILQYGLNIVRNESENYLYYQHGLYRQLKLIGELRPGTPVLVMGVTDIARSERDSVSSYSDIAEIRDAQKNAAADAGAAFWDTWEAMGGKNSIVRWSEKNPPLAQKDYVHLTYQGADTLASMLVKDIFPFKENMSVNLAQQAINDSVRPAASDTAEPAITEPAKGLISTVVTNVFTYNPDDPFIFTTAGFWIFLMFVLAGYSLVYRRITLRNVYLFIISLFFYFRAGGLFLFLLIFVTVIDYSCGLLIARSVSSFRKRLFLIISVVSNLGLLAYFKYAAFIVDSINSLLGTEIRVFDLLSSLSNTTLGTSFDTGFIILPVGISFFTFQSLSYTIDVYRKKMDPVRNIIDFGFYVSFFPHLVAGPIVRASVFMPQVYQEFSLTRNEFSHALFMISKGLIKKILISNFIALNFVDRVFDAPAAYSGFENLMAVYGYGLQIYCDFSGYTDIAIGVALILGFRLPVNFNSPYKASSVTDFWRRWHISLSRWLKDYLYISLGGSRKGRFRTYFNLMITMLLGGLWHGAALRFIIWGGLHGAGLVFDRMRQAVFGEGGRMKWLVRFIGIIITFNFVNFCWIFFRAGTMDDALVMISQMIFSFSPGSYADVLPAYGPVFILMVTGYIIHFLPEETRESYRAVFIKVPVAAQLIVILIIASVLFQMRTTGVMPFIYFRF
jgi:D-alanyl-lipoteichoic acid acyltransferase DltB (MBOAT superfamily)